MQSRHELLLLLVATASLTVVFAVWCRHGGHSLPIRHRLTVNGSASGALRGAPVGALRE